MCVFVSEREREREREMRERDREGERREEKSTNSAKPLAQRKQIVLVTVTSLQK